MLEFSFSSRKAATAGKPKEPKPKTKKGLPVVPESVLKKRKKRENSRIISLHKKLTVSNNKGRGGMMNFVLAAVYFDMINYCGAFFRTQIAHQILDLISSSRSYVLRITKPW
jgi:hypothetical protein